LLKTVQHVNDLYIKIDNKIKHYCVTKYFYMLKVYHLFSGSLTRQIFHWARYFITKFSFIGKTYRMLKRKKHIKLFFNRAHITFLFFKNFFKVKKLKKNKIKLLFILKYDYYNFKTFIKQIRNVNIFTKRGIKMYNLVRFSKKGKISTYR